MLSAVPNTPDSPDYTQSASDRVECISRIDSLAVKMDTQLGLHERYTDAFLKFAIDIRMLAKQVDNLQGMTDKEARGVYKQLLDISHEINGLEKNIEGLKSNLKEQMVEYKEITRHFSDELARHRDSISPEIDAVGMAVADAAKVQRESHDKIARQIDELIEYKKQTLSAALSIREVIGDIDPAEDDSKPLSLNITKLARGLRKFNSFLWGFSVVGGTLAAIWALWQALIQLGFMHQDWFPHAK